MLSRITHNIGYRLCMRVVNACYGATAHTVINDRRYRPIGPLYSLYSFHSRSKTIVELIVAVEIMVVLRKMTHKKMSMRSAASVHYTTLLDAYFLLIY